MIREKVLTFPNKKKMSLHPHQNICSREKGPGILSEVGESESESESERKSESEGESKGGKWMLELELEVQGGKGKK